MRPPRAKRDAELEFEVGHREMRPKSWKALRDKIREKTGRTRSDSLETISLYFPVTANDFSAVAIQMYEPRLKHSPEGVLLIKISGVNASTLNYTCGVKVSYGTAQNLVSGIGWQATGSILRRGDGIPIGRGLGG